MQFPESWLRTLVNPSLDTEQLAHCLTMAGLEVEETDPVAPAFSGIVVARITAVEPHPDADRLRVCQVDDGSGTPLQIVCGAPNAAVGLVAPLARIGAVLPGDFKIKKARMRGVDSYGMLCSARELGLSDEHEGLLALPDTLTPGQDIRAALALDDILFTLKLTPNRADCLSLLGVAREVSALTGAPLNRPAAQAVPATLTDRLPVTIHDADLCGRFAGRVIKGVNARAATPDWMVQRLERAGQRSISALVDISNYIMLELGRPTHVYDLAKIPQGLEVRWAREGEQLTLLNEQTVTLSSDVGLILSNGQPTSLAGIMGGDDSAVTLDTTDIYIEAAFWWPEAIMGKARRYKFSSEASHRFERGVDFDGLAPDLERMTRLILDVCGGQAGPLDDHIARLPVREPVSMRLSRCQRVLGVQVSREQVDDIFSRLGLSHDWVDDVVTVQPPTYRFDLEIEEDLIEEIARVYGFENLPDAPPVAPAVMHVRSETQRDQHQLRHVMAALDYQEVINFSFVEADWEQDYAGNDTPIKLLNPIASHLSVMRSGLIAGLVANIRRNAQRQHSRVRVFELGRVFMRDSTVQNDDLSVAGVNQPLRLAAAAWGPAVPEQWATGKRTVDFYDIKNDLEHLLGKQAADLRFKPAPHPALHPGRSAHVWLADQAIGWIGELHPRLAQDAELNTPPVVFELDVAALLPHALPAPVVPSRQPIVQRDLAIWVNKQVSYQALRDTLAQTMAAHDELAIIKDIVLFDVWRPSDQNDNRKSMGLRFWLQDTQATLDDARVGHCMKQVLQTLAEQHDASLRV